MTTERPAPAKVNLFLHVGAPAADGYHPLASWAVFADIGDTLTLEPDDRWTVEVRGEFAAEITGENLVDRALARLFERTRSPPPTVRLTLTKRLPVASGLGGGTSDAAAALRLVNAALKQPADEALLRDIAAELGADGAVCSAAAPVLMQGRGERLAPAPETPPLPVVLINPRVPSSTAAVYRAYDAGELAQADLPPLPARFETPEAVADALRPLRNDLEEPAVSLAPLIGEALALTRSAPETLLARMSGSGATVFALCADDALARALARRLSDARPEWWIRPARLSG